METVLIKLDEDKYRIEDLQPAVSVLKKGGLVAFPTETVYGLGGNALDGEASQKIYRAKGRPSDNPLIVHIANVKDMEDLARDIPDKAYQLAKVFWPGPLTIILKKKDKLPMSTTGGLDTVGIRLPANRVARDLIGYSGIHIAAPSANISGKPSPTEAHHVYHDLAGKIDMIIDGGKATLGLESTIVDLTTEEAVILRPGSITKEMLENVIGQIDYDSVILSKELDESLVPKAPGMKYKHYAPEGKLVIYEGEPSKVISTINNKVNEIIEKGAKIGIIATEETNDLYSNGIVKAVGTRKDETTIAAGLYSVLREFDELHVDYIFSESFPEEGLGQAIMNRLLKAAGYHLVTV